MNTPTTSFEPVICRPARAEDRARLLPLARPIGEKDDFLPEVLDEWLADQQGRLIVAERDSQVLGMAKLTCLSDQDWWLEGLRVHPAHDGQGVASQLHSAMIQAWEGLGAKGTVRLLTASDRIPVHRLCAKTGFVQSGSFTHYCAAPSCEITPSLTPVRADELGTIQAVLHDPRLYPMHHGHMNFGWRWTSTSERLLIETIVEGRAWWLGQGGVLMVSEDHEHNQRTMVAQLVACPQENLTNALLALRSLAAKAGTYQQVAWNIPDDVLETDRISSTGFGRDEANSWYLFGRSQSHNE